MAQTAPEYSIREDTAIHKRLLNLGVEISTLNDIRTNNLTIFKKLPIDVQLKNRKVISSFFESYQASWEYVFNKKSQKTFISRKNKPISLSIHLTDHCNLNCKGCSHFAPIANEYYISKLELESTLQLLNDADECIISELVLMGGEPLLHPKLGEILSLCRHYLKDIPLKIVTNGLIVQSISDDIWELCKQFDISVEITCYPIEVNYMDLISYLKNKKVKVNVYVDRRNGEFRKDVLNPKANYNNSLNYAKCRIGGLYPQIKNNKIFRCATAANIHILNSTFGTEFKYDEFDYLPLEDIKSMDEIRDFLMHPAPFCKYCNISQQRKEKWEISSKNKDEWLEID